jgi:hypothetical protein
MVAVNSVTPVIAFTSRWRRSKQKGLDGRNNSEGRGVAEVDGAVRGVAKEDHAVPNHSH